jgi:hypothetical protein
MARKTKKGLDYFPMDVDFFDDDKLRFVAARFSDKGELITIKLLSRIYKTNGYFYQWGEDEALLFANSVGQPHTLVNDVVQELVKRDFFKKVIFDRFKILTSTGIQERYVFICKQSKRIFEIDERLDCQRLKLLKDELTPKKDELTPEDSNEITEEMRQRKGKEIKVKEMKGKSVESETWISESCMAYSTDKHTLLNYCDSWILKAIPSGKFEQYGANAIIGFMLKDFDKEKNNNNGKQTRQSNNSELERLRESAISHLKS